MFRGSSDERTVDISTSIVCKESTRMPPGPQEPTAFQLYQEALMRVSRLRAAIAARQRYNNESDCRAWIIPFKIEYVRTFFIRHTTALIATLESLCLVCRGTRCFLFIQTPTIFASCRHLHARKQEFLREDSRPKRRCLGGPGRRNKDSLRVSKRLVELPSGNAQQQELLPQP